MSSIKIQTTMEEVMFSCHIPTVMKVTTDMSGVTFVLKDAETETEVIRLSLDAYDGTIDIYDELLFYSYSTKKASPVS